MKKSSLLIALIVVLMTILTGFTFVGTHLLFKDQPGIENVFSIIWTVALIFVMYRLFLYAAPTKNVSRQEWRQDMYGGLVFLCEMLAVASLIMLAVVFSNLVTAGGAQTSLLLSVGLLIVLAVAVPVGVRVIRTLNRRSLEG